MASRINGRLLTIWLAGKRSITQRRKRAKPFEIKKILVCHQLLIGDTIMLSPLFAKLRDQHPKAEIFMAGPKGYLPLFSTNPWGVKAISLDPRDPRSIRKLCHTGNYDLALIPGDNRYSWLAKAAGASWIVGFDGNSSWYKNFFIDEFRPWPNEAMALGDIFSTLIEGPNPKPYSTNQWSIPNHQPFALPPNPYVVFHVGASSALKLWPADRWQALAKHLEARGLEIIFTPGRGELRLVNEIDPQAHYRRMDLDLAQMFKLLSQAKLVISPDTGIAHLARVAGAPSATLFGPGSEVAFGPGKFWSEIPWQAIGEKQFPCRDQNKIFGRESPNILRCSRSTQECTRARCMEAISIDKALAACESMLQVSQ